MFGMIMFVMLMTVSFSACSSDDGSEPNGSHAKKVSRIVYTEDGETFENKFVYDSTGQVVSATYSDNEGSDKTSYRYEASKM